MNYKEFAELLDKYKDEKFSIMAFPCNQFGGQEPGTADEIAAFAAERGFVGAAALLMAKVDVNGPTASPVFDWSLLFSRFVGGEGGVKGCSAPPPPTTHTHLK